jgi:hypothetical protein
MAARARAIVRPRLIIHFPQHPNALLRTAFHRKCQDSWFPLSLLDELMVEGMTGFSDEARLPSPQISMRYVMDR